MILYDIENASTDTTPLLSVLARCRQVTLLSCPVPTLALCDITSMNYYKCICFKIVHPLQHIFSTPIRRDRRHSADKRHSSSSGDRSRSREDRKRSSRQRPRSESSSERKERVTKRRRRSSSSSSGDDKPQMTSRWNSRTM